MTILRDLNRLINIKSILEMKSYNENQIGFSKDNDVLYESLVYTEMFIKMS